MRGDFHSSLVLFARLCARQAFHHDLLAIGNKRDGLVEIAVDHAGVFCENVGIGALVFAEIVQHAVHGVSAYAFQELARIIQGFINGPLADDGNASNYAT